MSSYPGKGVFSCLLSNGVKKVDVYGCISLLSDLPKFWMAIEKPAPHLTT